MSPLTKTSIFIRPCFNLFAFVLFCFLHLELKDGRMPHGLSSRLGYWKTEEFQKFSYPASEVILAGLLEPMDYHLWLLTVRMTELIFNHRNMWSHDDFQLFEHLVKRFIILNEEQRGLTACRITAHTKFYGSNEPKQVPIKALNPHREPWGNQQ